MVLHMRVQERIFVRAACKSLMTLPPFVRVTASTEASSRRRRSCKAEDGLIVTNKAWCAKREDGQFIADRTAQCSRSIIGYGRFSQYT